MIRIRKSSERPLDSSNGHDVWLMFSPDDKANASDHRFGGLQLFNEERIPPRAGARSRWQQDTEIVTYVREGTLCYQDSAGRSAILQAGSFSE
jgi:redox-sensitive bicupin YhaK (pirin superfamily)